MEVVVVVALLCWWDGSWFGGLGVDVLVHVLKDWNDLRWRWRSSGADGEGYWNEAFTSVFISRDSITL